MWSEAVVYACKRLGRQRVMMRIQYDMARSRTKTFVSRVHRMRDRCLCKGRQQCWDLALVEAHVSMICRIRPMTLRLVCNSMPHLADKRTWQCTLSGANKKEDASTPFSRQFGRGQTSLDLYCKRSSSRARMKR